MVGLLYLVGTIVALLLLALAMCFDTRRPMSTKLKYRYRVKDSSVFRKIIKFKDMEHYPCNYFKIVPFYVFFLLAILAVLLFFINLFGDGIIINTVAEEIFLIIALCILAVSMLYFFFVIVWWEIVDYKEFKFTKEEKERLKELRMISKETKCSKRKGQRGGKKRK